MRFPLSVLTFAVAATAWATLPPPPPPPDISVIAADGKANGQRYTSTFFGLTVDAPNAEIKLAPLVNTAGQRARLAQILGGSSNWDERYTFGVLAEHLSMQPQLQSLTQYVRSVRHQMEKQGLPTVREEFPIDISGVPFTGAVVREQTSDGQKYFRGFYSTSRRGYLLSFDVEGPSETAPNDLVRKLVHFSQPEYLFVCTSSLTSEPCATPPHVVEAPNADIPEAMRKKKLEGKPLLWLIVDVDGRPQDVRVAKSAGRELDEAAVNVVKRWKFSPGRANGKPVPVAINVEANFQPD